MSNDLIMWLRQQLENQRFRAESLKTLAHALPADADTYLRDTAGLLLADVDAKWRQLDWLERLATWADDGNLWSYDETEGLKLLALSYANCEGYRPEWRPE